MCVSEKGVLQMEELWWTRQEGVDVCLGTESRKSE